MNRRISGCVLLTCVLLAGNAFGQESKARDLSTPPTSKPLVTKQVAQKLAAQKGTTKDVRAKIVNGQLIVETRVEQGVPLLSKIPYVSRLFKNVGIGRQVYDLSNNEISIVATDADGKPIEERIGVDFDFDVIQAGDAQVQAVPAVALPLAVPSPYQDPLPPEPKKNATQAWRMLPKAPGPYSSIRTAQLPQPYVKDHPAAPMSCPPTPHITIQRKVCETSECQSCDELVKQPTAQLWVPRFAPGQSGIQAMTFTLPAPNSFCPDGKCPNTCQPARSVPPTPSIAGRAQVAIASRCATGKSCECNDQKISPMMRTMIELAQKNARLESRLEAEQKMSELKDNIYRELVERAEENARLKATVEFADQKLELVEQAAETMIEAARVSVIAETAAPIHEASQRWIAQHLASKSLGQPARQNVRGNNHGPHNHGHSIPANHNHNHNNHKMAEENRQLRQRIADLEAVIKQIRAARLPQASPRR